MPRYRYSGDDVRVFPDFGVVAWPGDVFDDRHDGPVPDDENLTAMRLEHVARHEPLVSNDPVPLEDAEAAEVEDHDGTVAGVVAWVAVAPAARAQLALDGENERPRPRKSLVAQLVDVIDALAAESAPTDPALEV